MVPCALMSEDIFEYKNERCFVSSHTETNTIAGTSRV